MITAAIEEQIDQLSREYGAPVHLNVGLSGWPFDPLYREDRYGEVCMVIRRPSGRLLTAIKTYYPANCFRLPTGGISHGEQIYEALLREVAEETNLEVRVARFLAVIEYHLAQPEAPDLHFVTCAFLLDEISGTLMVNDPNERHAAFREIWPDELPELALQLDAAPVGFDPEIGGSWHDWGKFRAVVHRVVAEQLQG